LREKVEKVQEMGFQHMDSLRKIISQNDFAILVEPTVALIVFAEPHPLGPPGDLLDGMVCKWIHGDTDDQSWRMCGRPAVGEGSWCFHHAARVALSVQP
jgi:hypothetical protein